MAASATVASDLPASEGNPKTVIPHYYLSVDLEMDSLLAGAKSFDAVGEEGNFVEAFVVKASAAAMRKVPDANSAWMPTATRQFNDVNIACRGAAGVEYHIPTADIMPIRTTAKAAESGAAASVAPTFTVDFLDDLAFARDIVGHGQSCVLTVGKPRPASVMRDGKLGSRTMVTCTLSCDHRTVDGAVGAAWLQAFTTAFQTPATLLI